MRAPLMGRALPVICLPLFLAIVASGCRRESSTAPPGEANPRAYRLRYDFEKGWARRYDSRTVETGLYEVTIEMRHHLVVSKAPPSGDGELEILIERYRQSVVPARQLPEDTITLNRSLAGATFEMSVSADGARVEHRGQRDLPPPLSEGTVEALKATLSSHVLKLPEKAVRPGQRWTVSREGDPASPGSLSTTSQWRVLSARDVDGSTKVELVCLSTMEATPMPLEGGVVAHNSMEFHYAFVWNATEGFLESLRSSGSTSTWTVREGAGPSAKQVTRFEGDLRLIVAERAPR